MFENFTLAKKITLGFALIIVLVLLLGGTAIIRLIDINNNSHILSEEYAPAVDAAIHVSDASYNTMYEVRGYAFTKQDSYLETGKKHIQNVIASIDKAQKLGEESKHLQILTENSKKAKEKALFY